MKKYSIVVIILALAVILFFACGKKDSTTDPTPPVDTMTFTITPTHSITPTVTVTPTITPTSTATHCVAFGTTSGTVNYPNWLGGLLNTLYMKYTVTSAATVYRIAANVGAGESYTVGIYTDSSGAPGTRLTVSSAIAVSTSGWNYFDVPDISVSVGTYWLAIASDALNGYISCVLNTPSIYTDSYTPPSKVPAVVTLPLSLNNTPTKPLIHAVCNP